MAKLSTYERMMRRVIPNEDGCWIFTGYKEKFGYGRVNTPLGVDRTHRVSYKHFYGDITKNLCVLHVCDVPACCNPNHLFLGTRAENAVDKAKKQRDNRKLAGCDVAEIRLAKGTHQHIANKYGVTSGMVTMIKNGRARQYV